MWYALWCLVSVWDGTNGSAIIIPLQYNTTESIYAVPEPNMVKGAPNNVQWYTIVQSGYDYLTQHAFINQLEPCHTHTNNDEQ